MFPGDLFLCFKIVNLTANTLTLALLILWLRRFVGDWRIRVALGLMFLLQWDTPTRWLYFYPAHTDPCMWVFLLASLLAVERYREQPGAGRMLLVAVLGAVGVAFREVVLVVPAAFLFARNPVREAWRRGAGFWHGATCLGRLGAKPRRSRRGLAALLAVRVMVRQTNDYSFAATAAHFLYDKPWPVYLQSVFLAFGPVGVVPDPSTGGRPVPFWPAGNTSRLISPRSRCWGLIGGTDTERLLYWAMPVVYVLIGRTLEEQRAEPVAAVVAAGGLSPPPNWSPAGPSSGRSRIIPAPTRNVLPVFTPFGRKIPFMELFSYYQSHPVQLASLAAYLAVGALLALWLGWKRQGHRTVPLETPRGWRDRLGTKRLSPTRVSQNCDDYSLNPSRTARLPSHPGKNTNLSKYPINLCCGPSR